MKITTSTIARLLTDFYYPKPKLQLRHPNDPQGSLSKLSLNFKPKPPKYSNMEASNLSVCSVYTALATAKLLSTATTTATGQLLLNRGLPRDQSINFIHICSV